MAEHRKLEGKGICKCGRVMYFDKGRWWCPKATPKLKPTRKYKKLWKVVKLVGMARAKPHNWHPSLQRHKKKETIK